jgi:hypothetical protein
VVLIYDQYYLLGTCYLSIIVLKCVFTSVRAAAYLFLRARGYARMHEISADSGRGCGYVHVADSGRGRGVQYAGANLCRKYPGGYYPISKCWFVLSSLQLFLLV